MALQDKQIQCSDCGTSFTFSAADQEFFQSKGYTNEPKRCAPCRSARKTERGGSTGGFGGGRSSQMYPAVCAACGQNTQVPFQPRGDKPVYCSDCFRKVGSNR
ncbi:CxxC-x17-CxxC domain-containing protein [Dehalogenimonas sp. THU2]|uniref:CxxC-x17-CxxC domain-containing protein n=1 Tax=Dehalogenimonas sp. THU2 TaxID=3151121 RepID=UPI003218D5A9